MPVASLTATEVMASLPLPMSAMELRRLNALEAHMRANSYMGAVGAPLLGMIRTGVNTVLPQFDPAATVPQQTTINGVIAGWVWTDELGSPSLDVLAASLLTVVNKADVLADLKATPTTAGKKVQTFGRNTINDGFGGSYYWDAASNAAEDTTYFNTIRPDSVPVNQPGRWVRSFQRVRLTNSGHGTVLTVGPIKFLFISGVTNAQGEFVCNMTEENTVNGTAIFSTLLWYDCRSVQPANIPGNAVDMYSKTLTLPKTITYGSRKFDLLNVLLPIGSAGQNVPVLAFAIGM